MAEVTRHRIDKRMHELGLAPSRSKAQAYVMAGIVLVNDKRVEKPSEMVKESDVIRIKSGHAESRFVGRGGLKLEEALNVFEISPAGHVCLDVGSSTGGFTDCLLQNGARQVYAIDVGTNQLVWKLRSDPRVIVRENINARHLTPGDFPELFDLITIDVSFISVTKLLKNLVPLLKRSGKIITLIKPQFEVGKGEVEKGGLVHDETKHKAVIAKCHSFAESLGLRVCGTTESPIRGAAGNREFLSVFEYMPGSSVKREPGADAELVEGEDYYFESGLMVLTASFLLRRGYCCGNGCRHCPYPESPTLESE